MTSKVLCVVLVVLAGCATASFPPSGRVTVSALTTPGVVALGKPYEVVFVGVTGTEPSTVITRACFTWQSSRGSDGPHCRSGEAVEVDMANRQVRVKRLSTRMPDSYTLWGYLVYLSQGKERESNAVRASLRAQ
jgi:hypothetical protein